MDGVACRLTVKGCVIGLMHLCLSLFLFVWLIVCALQLRFAQSMPRSNQSRRCIAHHTVSSLLRKDMIRRQREALSRHNDQEADIQRQIADAFRREQQTAPRHLTSSRSRKLRRNGSHLPTRPASQMQSRPDSSCAIRLDSSLPVRPEISGQIPREHSAWLRRGSFQQASDAEEDIESLSGSETSAGGSLPSTNRSSSDDKEPAVFNQASAPQEIQR